MTVMAAEQNASSEAMNTVAYEEGWLDVESANAWDAEWYWGSETSGINNDSEMWCIWYGKFTIQIRYRTISCSFHRNINTNNRFS